MSGHNNYCEDSFEKCATLCRNNHKKASSHAARAAVARATRTKVEATLARIRAGAGAGARLARALVEAVAKYM